MVEFSLLLLSQVKLFLILFVYYDVLTELGVLVGKGGYFGNVFRITPPLCFTKDDADYLVEAMDYSMSRM